MKKLAFIKKSNGSHWVGDGFPVRNIFSYTDIAPEMSPFLMMDYAGPKEFPPTSKKLGVGEHPHRGFETVTIVYDGEVEHRDSAGGGGKIGPGDVQWMTAAAGLVHEEFHGSDFAKKGGMFEMIQLWVNLPKKDKMTKPRYQGILNSQIPQINLPEEAGSVRVIAGEYQGKSGAALTFSPMDLWDVRLRATAPLHLKLKEGNTAALFVLKGKIKINSGEKIGEAEMAVMEREGDSLSISALEDSVILFMGGEPIAEPIVGHGPFVMNTKEEIHQAIMDYQSGKMGKLH
jgi:redox-sensitive bicupin YhaK (pirin superfamily)